MALGRDHDRATALATVPVALVITLTLGPWPGVGAGLGCLIGGYWLSPDLDTHCQALKRWGPLRLIWAPYRWLIPHRSLWSHGPLLGTTTRLLLLGGWLALATAALPTVSPIDLWSTLEAWGRSNPTLLIAVLLGLEVSCWLHLILDGDPLPAEWHRRRRRRRR